MGRGGDHHVEFVARCQINFRIEGLDVEGLWRRDGEFVKTAGRQLYALDDPGYSAACCCAMSSADFAARESAQALLPGPL